MMTDNLRFDNFGDQQQDFDLASVLTCDSSSDWLATQAMQKALQIIS